jgi:hypothetical protein
METEQMMKHLLVKTNGIQEKMDVTLREIRKDIRTWQKEMKANGEVSEVYPEKTEANPEEMKSAALHEEVLKEESAVEMYGALIKRNENQHHRKLKKQAQGNRGVPQEVGCICTGMTRHAVIENSPSLSRAHTF